MRLFAGLPVLLIYGRLADGETFLVRDDRQRSCFFARTSDGEAVQKLAGTTVKLVRTTRQTLAGEPVSRVELATPAATAALVHRLHAAGIATFEADVSMVMRYLTDRGIRSSIEIHGAERRGRSTEEGVDLVFENPELTPGSALPRLTHLTLRLQAGPDGTLAAAAIADRHGEIVLHRQLGPEASVDATCFADERSLLGALIQRLVTKDPDLIIGWNLLSEDLPLLREAARRCRMSLPLARGPGDLQYQAGHGRGQMPRAVLSGRVIFDVAPLWRHVKGAGHEDSLSAILESERGLASKQSGSSVRSVTERLRYETGELLRFMDDHSLIDLAMQRSRLTGLPIDRATASVAAFDFLYLIELGRRGYVAPTFERPSELGEHVVGGQIISPLPGLHRNVLVFDFRSLYPSVIRTFQIDPLGLLTGDSGVEPDPIVAPSGARFRRQRGILTVILDQLLPLRSAARSQGNEAQSQAIKLLMNSLYGVLGSPSCRFHRPELANAVTSFGRELLKWSQARLESYGHRVLYGDTDSLFVLANLDEGASPEALQRLGQSLASRLNEELAIHIEATWRVESQIELTLQSVYQRLLLHRQRGKESGAAKRYAGLVWKGDQTRLHLVGLEAVRRDSSELCRKVQLALYTMLFADAPAAEVELYLHRTVAELRAGKLDAMLVYRKTLRREPTDYVAKHVPHVVVGARHGLLPGSVVPYVVTRVGPEHPDHRQHPLDYSHYIEKQIRSVAEPILVHYGLSFSRIDNGDPQLRLL